MSLCRECGRWEMPDSPVLYYQCNFCNHIHGCGSPIGENQMFHAALDRQALAWRLQHLVEVEKIDGLIDILRSIELREKARLEKDWAWSDQIRAHLLKIGVEIEDTKDGPKMIIGENYLAVGRSYNDYEAMWERLKEEMAQNTSVSTLMGELEKVYSAHNPEKNLEGYRKACQQRQEERNS